MAFNYSDLYINFLYLVFVFVDSLSCTEKDFCLVSERVFVKRISLMKNSLYFANFY
ncbi:hypothetical protein MXB_624 [Myxobolus squamalis]|nr:hypothetical protein MXB_624 [Myxobolus squamalis]